jgi:hypothetical protein
MKILNLLEIIDTAISNKRLNREFDDVRDENSKFEKNKIEQRMRI